MDIGLTTEKGTTMAKFKYFEIKGDKAILRDRLGGYKEIDWPIKKSDISGEEG